MQEVIEYGYEGLVAKDPHSPYGPRRKLKWLKIKQARHRDGQQGWSQT